MPWRFSIFFCFALLWALAFLIIFPNAWTYHQVNYPVAISELSIQGLTVFYAWKIFTSGSHSSEKTLLLCIFLSVLALFLNEFFYYVLVFIKTRPGLLGAFPRFLLFYLSYLAWLIILIFLIFQLLRKYVFEAKTCLILFSCIVLINFTLILLLFFSKNPYLSAFLGVVYAMNFSSIYREIVAALNFSSFCELILFDLTLIALICTKHSGLRFFLVGVAFIISSAFLYNYAFVAYSNDRVPHYANLLWFLAILLMFTGAVFIRKERFFNLRDHFSKINTINSNLIIWTFGVSVGSFLIFFISAYYFSLVNDAIFGAILFFLATYSVIVIILSMPMGKRFEAPFNQLTENIQVFMDEHNKTKLKNQFSLKEFIFLNQFVIDAIAAIEEKDRAKKKLGEIATQVAHDIRSPLVALNTSLKHLPQIPEDQRILIRNAANRINDIANNLLQQYKTRDQLKVLQSNWLVAPVVESIISEKRLQYESQPIQLEAEISNQGFAAFALFDANEMKRVLSNLTNNSIEAFPESGGKILIKLDADEVSIFIHIQDNGHGIPQDRLKEVLKAGVSLKEKGSGLGLSHAVETVESFNGKLKLDSTVGKGTTVSITLPRSVAPSWFVSEIIVSPEMPIAILDDDQSVHHAWEQRLVNTSKEFEIHHFRKSTSFVKWYRSENRPVQVFSDYELLGETKTGLDVLEALAIRNNAVLITSHYENSEIIRRCQMLGAHLLPKNLLAHIPIQLLPVVNFEQIELVLIDDSKMLRRGWEFAAELSGKHILTVASPTDFEKVLSKLTHALPIYIDSELGYSMKGEEYAKKLFDLGFKEIYLITGHPASDFQEMSWIRRAIAL